MSRAEELMAALDGEDNGGASAPPEIQGDPHPEYTDAELMALHVELTRSIGDLRESLWLVTKSMTLRMQARGATELALPNGTATLREDVHWDEDHLALLKGLLSDEEYVSLLNMPKPRTHDKRKVNALVKRGGAVKTVIDESRKLTGYTLVVKTEEDTTELAAD